VYAHADSKPHCYTYTDTYSYTDTYTYSDINTYTYTYSDSATDSDAAAAPKPEGPPNSRASSSAERKLKNVKVFEGACGKTNQYPSVRIRG
jgi:hypothetical protein